MTTMKMMKSFKILLLILLSITLVVENTYMVIQR